MKYKRVVITRHGGLEVLQVVEDELPEPQIGQVRVKILASLFHSIGGARWLAIVSAAVSLLLVVTFWHPYLIAGLLIDAAVLVTLLFTKWSPG